VTQLPDPEPMSQVELEKFLADNAADMKAKFDRGWRPIDDPVVMLGNEFVEAIKDGTVDGWSYDPDRELIRCDDGDRHRVWRLSGMHNSHAQEAIWPD
jgi:hypothetical protein